MAIIIDGTDLILGRLAATVTKQALLGKEIVIVNCENIILTGRREDIFAKYKTRRDMGHPLKGPYFPRAPDRITRRAIRGMLPYKQEKGKTAFKRIMCYVGVPEQYKDKKLETIEQVHISKSKTIKYINLKELSAYLGKEIK